LSVEAGVGPREWWTLYAERGRGLGWTSWGEYARWREGMTTLQIFWAEEERRVLLLGARDEGRLVGVARLAEVPVRFHQRSAWRGVAERLELQDLAAEDPGALREILRWAERRASIAGLPLGVSSWDPVQWEVLESEGLSPYARSVLLGWDPGRPIPLEPNPRVEVRLGNRRDRPVLRKIQLESWGFFIPPSFDRQDVLVATLDGEPVGSAYLNRASGNVDFGVHVRRGWWRRRIGTALLEACRRRCLELGLPRMTVVRVIPLTKVRESDARALGFYLACGAVPLREVRGFRRKARRRALRVVSLSEAIPQLYPESAVI